jgi:hypothetical protein
MKPSPFPGTNAIFGPPPGYDRSQIATVPALMMDISGGSMDGSMSITVAWKPDEADLKRLNQGGLIYLCVVGGLVPHFLTTSLEESGFEK